MTATRVIARRAVRGPWPALAWSLGLSCVLLWPQRHGGYGLGHDLVFTPDQPLSWGSLGLGSASPRAVPLDALVALLGKLLGGQLLGRLALLLPLLGAGVGAARLVGYERGLGPLVAAGFAVWNPYVIERLAIGQWALLWAYAALPWIAVMAARWRESGRGGGGLVLWIAAASITPTGGLIGAGVGCILAAPAGRRPGGTRRGYLRIVAAAVVLQLPWIVPSLLGPAGLTSDPAAVAAFASRAEHSGGVALTLLGGGGIWDAQVVPPSRSGILAWIGLALVVIVAVLGAPAAHRALGAATTRRASVCVVLGLLLAGVLPGTSVVIRLLVEHVPGAGLLRDSQKWAMPYVIALAVCCGFAATRLTRLAVWRFAAGCAAIVLPLLVLPDAARTVRPTLEPVRYPADWSWAARALHGDSAVAVLPFQSYRIFDWTPGRSVLDPAPRLLPGDVIVSDQLVVAGRVLSGEDPRARQVALALTGGAGLPARLGTVGVGWVLVEKGTPGAVPDLAELRLVRSGPDLSLYRVDGPVTVKRPGVGRTVFVLGADAVAVAVCGLAGWACIRRPRR